MARKSIFKSKSAFLGFATAALGAIAFFLPDTAGALIKANSPAILSGIGPIAILLRLITKDAVSLFPKS